MAGFSLIGFETGDTSEWPVIVGTVSAVTSAVISGAYSCKVESSGSTSYLQSAAGLNKSIFGLRCKIYVHVTTNPGAQQELTLIRFERSGSVLMAAISLFINTDGTIALYGGVFTTFAYAGPTSVTISVDTVYTIEVKVVVTGSGTTLEWKINGATQGRGSNSNASTVTQYFLRMLVASGSAYCIFDDVLADDADYPGPGFCICRQGKSGTPTYDSFTKVVGTTAQECWSETPYSVTKACTSITSGGAQTMLAESFANLQSGHGTETLWTDKGLTINACKVVMIAKVAVASSHSIRRRLNGVDTDSSESLTTADAYYDDGIWTDTLANINSMEIGVLHGANVNLLTVEDMWIMIDVNKGWILGPH